jgi:hypothetical protein
MLEAIKAKVATLIAKAEALVHAAVDSATGMVQKLSSVQEICIAALVASITLELVFSHSSSVIGYAVEQITKVGIQGAALVIILALIFKSK